MSILKDKLVLPEEILEELKDYIKYTKEHYIDVEPILEDAYNIYLLDDKTISEILEPVTKLAKMPDVRTDRYALGALGSSTYSGSDMSGYYLGAALKKIKPPTENINKDFIEAFKELIKNVYKIDDETIKSCGSDKSEIDIPQDKSAKRPGGTMGGDFQAALQESRKTAKKIKKLGKYCEFISDINTFDIKGHTEYVESQDGIAIAEYMVDPEIDRISDEEISNGIKELKRKYMAEEAVQVNITIESKKKAKDVILLIDVSGSMHGESYDTALGVFMSLHNKVLEGEINLIVHNYCTMIHDTYVFTKDEPNLEGYKTLLNISPFSGTTAVGDIITQIRESIYDDTYVIKTNDFEFVVCMDGIDEFVVPLTVPQKVTVFCLGNYNEHAVELAKRSKGYYYSINTQTHEITTHE
jgi:hypothetical protein